MAINVTWEENGVSEVWALDDAACASLENYRLTMQERRRLVEGGPLVVTLRYASVKEMIIGMFKEQLARPAMTMFPPAAITALIEQRRAADKALDDARRAIEDGLLKAGARA